MLEFPALSPIAFSIGNFHIHWYGIAYMLSIYLGGQQAKYFARKYMPELSQIENISTYIVLGIILGGRLGYILFYDLGYYMTYPLEVFKVWKGGMAFHGGLIGTIAAVFLYNRKIKQPFLKVTDLVSAVGPLAGIFIRAANFVNGELYGRPTDVPWGMIFPHSDGLVRHPSQLYEMFFEGFVLYALTNIAYIKKHNNTGFTTGVVLFFYGIFRFSLEFFREPDGMVGALSKGQALSVPLVIIGGILMISSYKKGKLSI